MSDGLRFRLLMTVDAVGGVWTYAIDLATGLAKRGVAVTFAVVGPAPDSQQLADAARVPGLQLVQLGLPVEWMANSVREVEAVGEALAELAASRSADIIQLNAPGPAANTKFPAPVVIVCHSCVATWWHTVRGGPMPGEFRWRAELVEKAYQRGALIVAPSLSFAEATRVLYGLPQRPHVVYNGRHLHPVSQAKLDEPVAFTAGRLWDEGKDAATLDRAAAELPFPLLAAGPDHGPNGARVALRHLCLLGPLKGAEVRERLATRPIFVSAARYEPFGLSVLEAAQAGCALVLADTPGFRELWDGAAEFVPIGDARAFSRTIRDVAADPTRRASLGSAASTRSSRYDLKRQVDAMLEAYLGILGRATGRNAAA